MTFCSSCGSEVSGRFCAKCGAQALVAAPAPEVKPPQVLASSAIRGDNVVSALCYTIMGFAGLLFLFVRPYSRSKIVRFHAFQSIFVGLALVITDLALKDLYPYWQYVYTPVRLFHALAMIFWFSLLAVTLLKKRIVVPVLGQVAEKLA